MARIERERRIGDRISAEVAYLVTSLTAAKAGPERLLQLARAHWGIENQLHYVRDVSMEEDRCRVRAGARALAALRNLVLHLIRSRGLSVREVTVFRDTLTVGFSHFVASMTAPVASGWSSSRVGLAPTGKRRLVTAHTQDRHRR